MVAINFSGEAVIHYYHNILLVVFVACYRERTTDFYVEKRELHEVFSHSIRLDKHYWGIFTAPSPLRISSLVRPIFFYRYETCILKKVLQFIKRVQRKPDVIRIRSTSKYIEFSLFFFSFKSSLFKDKTVYILLLPNTTRRTLCLSMRFSCTARIPGPRLIILCCKKTSDRKPHNSCLNLSNPRIISCREPNELIKHDSNFYYKVPVVPPSITSFHIHRREFT